MSILLVTYDLSSTGKDYSGLYTTLKSAPGWWHYIESCWLLKTKESAQDWLSKIKPHIDNDKDSLLIIEITPQNRAGWLPQKAWDWVKKNSESNL